MQSIVVFLCGKYCNSNLHCRMTEKATVKSPYFVTWAYNLLTNDKCVQTIPR